MSDDVRSAEADEPAARVVRDDAMDAGIHASAVAAVLDPDAPANLESESEPQPEPDPHFSKTDPPAAALPRLWRRILATPDQPAWARPALLLIAALAAATYSWGIASNSLENYYGAAARSMSQSWHDFFFGAFDPWGTITVDKLPGALWVQALSLRIFGFHVWAIALPQVIEGVLTVLVLYRAVRRLAGPVAALIASAALVITPVTTLLNRGNVSDSLLVLLLVLAADAVGRALVTGRLRSLVLAGIWVGLAFQTKMTQAWLVLPALAVPYLLAAPNPRLRVRVKHVAIAGVATVAVSLSWMTAVSFVPSHDRPFVDATQNDSEFTQVFQYNGLARLGLMRSSAGETAPHLRVLSAEGKSLTSATSHIKPGWHRLFAGAFGRANGPLLPAAIVAAAAIFWWRRRASRVDRARAAALLWSVWLATLFAVFSAGSYLNPYYLAVLTPGVAAIIGIAATTLGAPPWQLRIRVALSCLSAACVGYGLYLLHGAARVPPWIAPTAVLVAVVTIAAITMCGLATRPTSTASSATPTSTTPKRMVATATVAITCVCLGFLPAVATATSVAHRLGPFDTPYESSAVADATHVTGRNLALLTKERGTEPFPGQPHRALFGTDTAVDAQDGILVTGREVLPIGGYHGGVPAPTLNQIVQYINDGSIAVFVLPVAPRSDDPRLRWIEDNCDSLRPGAPGIVQFEDFYCHAHPGD